MDEQWGHADYQRWREESRRAAVSEVCIKTVVSYSCCIRATRKPES